MSTEKAVQVGGGAPMAPRDSVYIRSNYHNDAPMGYEIYEVVPKIFLKLRRGERLKEIQWLGAVRVEDDGRYTHGQYESENSWALPDTDSEEEKKVLRAKSAPDEGWSSDLHVSALQLTEMTDSRRNDVDVKMAAAGDLVEIGPKVAAGRTITKVYRGTFNRDPRVTISVIQGEELLRLLERRSLTYDAVGSFAASLDDDIAYFVDRPIDEGSASVDLSEGEAFTARLTLPVTEGARYAWALRFEITDWPYADPPPTLVTDPKFLKNVTEHPIVSDLPPSHIDGLTRNSFEEFEEGGRGLHEYADLSEDLSLRDAWDELCDLAEHLGVGGIHEAADFVRLAMPWGEPMPA